MHPRKNRQTPSSSSCLRGGRKTIRKTLVGVLQIIVVLMNLPVVKGDDVKNLLLVGNSDSFSLSSRHSARGKDPLEEMIVSFLENKEEPPPPVRMKNSTKLHSSDANSQLKEMVALYLEQERRGPLKTAEDTTRIYAVRYAIQMDAGGGNNTTTFKEYATDSHLQDMLGGERKWTWVLLHEQSETPGLYDTQFNNLFEESRNAIIELNHKVMNPEEHDRGYEHRYGYDHEHGNRNGNEHKHGLSLVREHGYENGHEYEVDYDYGHGDNHEQEHEHNSNGYNNGGYEGDRDYGHGYKDGYYRKHEREYQNNNGYKDGWGHDMHHGQEQQVMRSSSTADTILLMAWGSVGGDSNYPTIYPDYSTMQRRVAQGYYNYRDAITTPARPVKIAPAGLAFQKIHDEDTNGNYIKNNNNNNNTMSSIEKSKPSSFYFMDLYDVEDTKGSQPSIYGNYLVACVLYATLSGSYDRQTEKWMIPASKNELRVPPSLSGAGTLTDEIRSYLQSIAFDTVTTFYESNQQKKNYFYTPLITSTPFRVNEKPKKPYQPPPATATSSTTPTSKSSKLFSNLSFLASCMVISVCFVLYKKRQKQQDDDGEVFIRMRKNNYTAAASTTSSSDDTTDTYCPDAVELTSILA